MQHTKQLHGYVNNLAIIEDGEDRKTVKIMGGNGLKLFVKDLDGNVQECYHSSLRLIWDN
jgi:hypothetical protein